MKWFLEPSTLLAKPQTRKAFLIMSGCSFKYSMPCFTHATIFALLAGFRLPLLVASVQPVMSSICWWCATAVNGLFRDTSRGWTLLVHPPEMMARSVLFLEASRVKAASVCVLNLSIISRVFAFFVYGNTMFFSHVLRSSPSVHPFFCTVTA